MPLAFKSNSHGTVAFGFFNIEMDMLLLQQHFFFAGDFCSALTALSGGACEATMDGWRIDEPEKVGSLHGAIAGVSLTGFIGETYRLHPFPPTPEGFKQNPEPAMSHETAETLIAPYGEAEAIPLTRSAAADTVTVAEYVFGTDEFHRLVEYVDAGGYPRWRDEVRPAYVREMMQQYTGLLP